MRYRKLGETGLVVSEIGGGGVGLGHRWGAATDADAVAAVRVALEAGVTFFAGAARARLAEEAADDFGVRGLSAVPLEGTRRSARAEGSKRAWASRRQS